MLDYVISRVFCFIAIRFMHSSKILKWIERYLYTVLLFNYSSEGHILNMETWLHILVDLLMLYWTVTCVESRNFFTISWKCKGHFFFVGGGGWGPMPFWGNFSVSRSPLYLGVLLLLGNDSLIYYMNHYIFIMMIFTKIYYIYLKIFHFLCQTFFLM